MTKSILPAVAAALLALGGPALAPAPAPQDLGEQVAALEKQVLEAQTARQELELRTKKLEDDLATVQAWLGGLPAALTALDGKMNDARRDGFEAAGPNPRAKKAVLDGIKSFAATLSQGLKPAPEKPAEDSRR
ncbi:MAG: hypothetical protein R3F20_11260 [Planctomycetota bacterium]